VKLVEETRTNRIGITYEDKRVSYFNATQNNSNYTGFLKHARHNFRNEYRIDINFLYYLRMWNSFLKLRRVFFKLVHSTLESCFVPT
jgi:hypothetical protein